MVTSKNTLLYLKVQQNVVAKKYKVRLKDVAEIECSDKNLEYKIEEIVILQIPDERYHRYVISALKIIQEIHERFPDVDIQNIGDTDVIITYEPQKKKRQFLEYLKVAFVSAITFAGAAFAVMTFNNDISLTKMFAQIHEWVMGYASDGFTILEISYSVGVMSGILLFFQHFGGKRFSVDPTPIEVEMRTYEKDIQSTIIETFSRKEKELHVEQNDSSNDVRI